MSDELASHTSEAEERALAVAREAIDNARSGIAYAVNSAMVEAYWTIGKEIAETVATVPSKAATSSRTSRAA